MAGPLRLQEHQERQQAAVEGRQAQQQRDAQPDESGGDQRQAGSLDEAASDPTTHTSSSSSAMASQADEVDDDTLLQDLMDEVKDPKDMLVELKHHQNVIERELQKRIRAHQRRQGQHQEKFPGEKSQVLHRVQLHQVQLVEVQKLSQLAMLL